MPNYNPYYTPQSTQFTDIPEYGSFKTAFQDKIGSGEMALQGLSSGGPWGALLGAVSGDIMGATNQIKNEKQLIEDLEGYNTPGLATDQMGRPVYNLGSSSSNLKDVDTSNIGKINPLDPLGVGSLPALFGGKKRREKAEKARQEAIGKVKTFQENFNEASRDYSEQQASMLSRQSDLQERANRLYNIPNQYSNLF